MSPLLAITAATGIAAVNISGCTLHSWAGIGLGQESAEQIVGRLLGVTTCYYFPEFLGFILDFTDTTWLARGRHMVSTWRAHGRYRNRQASLILSKRTLLRRVDSHGTSWNIVETP